MKILREERGNVLVLTAFCMTMLLTFMAFAIDVGNLYYTQRQLQTLADAAAMAGALEISACGGTTSSSSCTVMQTAATSALTEGGISSSNINTIKVQQCTAPATASTGLSLTLNNGPCLLSGDPNSGLPNYVEVVVSEQIPAYFACFIGYSTFQASARAEAGIGTPAGGGGWGLIVTGPGQSVDMNGGTKITNAANSSCGVVVDSNDKDTCGGGAVSPNGGSVDVSSFNVVGKVCNQGTTWTSPSTPTTGATSVPDPYQAEYDAGTLSTPPKGTTSSSASLSSQGGSSNSASPTQLQPGYYPSGFTFQSSGGTNYFNLASGVYYMGGNVMVDAGASVSGTGVTIYMANGQMNVNSSAYVDLVAPTTGPTAGLVIWQPTSNTSQIILDAGSNSIWGGGVWAPGAQLVFNGSSAASANGTIAVSSVMLESSLQLGCSGGGGGAANGAATVALAE
jgi:Flp pilus assembly protein TadG